MTVKEIQSKLKARRKNTKYLTQKAIKIVMNCQKQCDYTAAHELKLYTQNSACYCELLEMI